MKQDTTPIDILTEAIANISARKDLFERGFRTDSEVAILMYNNYVLAIVASISLLKKRKQKEWKVKIWSYKAGEMPKSVSPVDFF